MTIVLTARQAADSPQFIPVLNNVRVRLPVGRPRTRPTAVAGDTGALLRRAYRCHVGAQWMETLIALCDTPLARNAGDSAHPSIAPDNSGDKELADAVLAEIPGPSSCRMRSGATWPYTPGTAPLTSSSGCCSGRLGQPGTGCEIAREGPVICFRRTSAAVAAERSRSTTRLAEFGRLSGPVARMGGLLRGVQ